MKQGDRIARQILLPLLAPGRFELSAFLAGRNRAAVESLRCIGAGESHTNLYLWGRPGTGKSHLLQATCGLAIETGRSTGYIPLAQIRDLDPDMLQGLETLDFLCIDDLQELAGSDAWEQALFHLFNRMRDAGKPLVLAADQGPVEIGIKLPDLKSRLGWDLGYHLLPLEEPELVDALCRRAELRGLELADDVIQYVLSRYARDASSLFQLLDRLDQESLVRQRKVTIPFVRELFAEMERQPPRR